MVKSYISVCIQITYVLTLLASVGEYHFRSLDSFGAFVTTTFRFQESTTNHIISDLILYGYERSILPFFLALGLQIRAHVAGFALGSLLASFSISHLPFLPLFWNSCNFLVVLAKVNLLWIILIVALTM